MRVKFLLLEIFLGVYVLKGQAIDSLGCTGALGDIKYSILEPEVFAGENGDCWILMEGNLIAGTRLNTEAKADTIPDARGYFIRSYDNRSSNRVDIDRVFDGPVGEVQEDEIKSHNHIRQNMALSSVINYQSGIGATVLRSLPITTFTTDTKGGVESRPKNISIYTYIRVN